MIEQFLHDLKPKREPNLEKKPENEMIRKFVKDKFFKELSELNIDLDIVSNGKRNKNEQFHKFNLFLCDQNYKRISLYDIVMFLEEDYFDIKSVLSCLNEENTYLLRKEMEIRFNKTTKKRNKKLELIIDE